MIGERPPAFASMVDNLQIATLSSTVHGTLVTGSASANVKGAWTQLIASLPYDVRGFFISFMRGSTAASTRNIRVDIGIGGAGAEQVLIPDLDGHSNVNALFGLYNTTFWPMHLAEGSRISARVQGNNASQPLDVSIRCLAGASEPPWPLAGGVEVLGQTGAASQGAMVTPGASNAFGSWTTIGTTTRNWFGFHSMVGMPQISVVTLNNLQWEIGYSSTRLTTKWGSATTTEYTASHFSQWPEFLPVPAGTVMQIRARSGTATVQATPFSLYGLY